MLRENANRVAEFKRRTSILRLQVNHKARTFPKPPSLPDTYLMLGEHWGITATLNKYRLRDSYWKFSLMLSLTSPPQMLFSLLARKSIFCDALDSAVRTTHFFHSPCEGSRFPLFVFLSACSTPKFLSCLISKHQCPAHQLRKTIYLPQPTSVSVKKAVHCPQ